MKRMSNPAVVAEIARLEAEIGRIQRELDTLKRSMGIPLSRKTQGYGAPMPAPTNMRNSETAEMPAQNDLGTPQPSVPLASETVPTTRANKSDRRVAQGGRTGLTDYPPPNANNTPTRRAANVDPGAGRYEYVGEGRSKPRR